MKLKSYFTDSIQDAVESARLELGPDAVLISSNRTGADLKDLGAYEVVFGLAAAMLNPRDPTQNPRQLGLRRQYRSWYCTRLRSYGNRSSHLATRSRVRPLHERQSS